MHCALEIRCKTSCKKCHIHSIYLQFPFLIYAHFFVAKTIYALFCHKKNLCTLFLSRTRFTRFFAKTIYALRLESFCALKVAIRKVQTFWASALCICCVVLWLVLVYGGLRRSTSVKVKGTVCLQSKWCKPPVPLRPSEREEGGRDALFQQGRGASTVTVGQNDKR